MSVIYKVDEGEELIISRYRSLGDCITLEQQTVDPKGNEKLLKDVINTWESYWGWTFWTREGLLGRANSPYTIAQLEAQELEEEALEADRFDDHIAMMKIEESKKPTHDPVNSPSHYNWIPGGIQPMDLCKHLSFCAGNAVKYIVRAGRKGDAIQDLNKAIFNIKEEIKRLEAEAK